MKKKIGLYSIIALIILLLLFYAFVHLRSAYDINVAMSDFGISIMGIEAFREIDIKNDKIMAKDNGSLLIISLNKNVNVDMAQRIVNDKIAVLESQYEIRNAPYPGEVTREVVCPEEFKPVKNIIDNQHSMANYMLYSTISFTYGVCAKDLIAYKAFFGLFYCEKRNNLVQIELFVPINNEKEFNESLKKISTFEC